MQDLNDKITGGTLTAPEWNEVPSEIQNVIEALGIVLSSGDLNQLSKAIAGYVANGTFYTDSGAADAYVLTQIGSKQAPTAYTDGMEVDFIPGDDSTGASTVNVAGLGVKNIADTAAAGKIIGGRRLKLRYRSGAGNFEIITNTIVQVVSFQDGEVATGTTVGFDDDTIPQNTEGTEFMTLAITPKNANNKLKIEVVLAYLSHTDASATRHSAALFQDATANALAVGEGGRNASTTSPCSIVFTHHMDAGTISSTTFKVRAWSTQAGTMTFNGQGGVRRFGGVLASSIIITEIEA